MTYDEKNVTKESDMTINTIYSPDQYSGNGSTTAFAYSFVCYDQDNLEVYLTDTSTNVDTLLTLTTDYTVSLDSDFVGGTVTLNVAPTNTQRVTIARNQPLLQGQDYRTAGRFPSEATERALDELTIITQDLKNESERTVRLPVTASTSATVELPLPSAGKAFRWNAAGTALEEFTPTSSESAILDVFATQAGGTYANASVASDAHRALAIGSGASVGAADDDGVAIGTTAAVTAEDGTAIGGSSTASGVRGTAIGNSSTASSFDSTAIGDNSEASGSSTVAIGDDSVASGANAVAIGFSADATVFLSYAMGSNAQSTGVAAVAIGADSSATATSAVSIGYEVEATFIDSIAIGTSADAKATEAIAIGKNADGTGDQSVALGRAALATGASCTAIGYGNQANETGALAIGGFNNVASGQYSVAMGNQSVADHTSEFAYSGDNRFAVDGDCQSGIFVLSAQTTDATPTELFLDGADTTPADRITLADGEVMSFKVIVTAVQTNSAKEAAGYVCEGLIANKGGTTAFIGGTPSVTVLGEDVAGWDFAVSADDTNDALVLTFTGAAGDDINIGARVDAMKIIG
jgi:hypothetical protein